jgi:hypothetical protein
MVFRGLETEVLDAFLTEIRKEGHLKDSVMSRLQGLVDNRSMTKSKLMKLIEENANSKDKEP